MSFFSVLSIYVSSLYLFLGIYALSFDRKSFLNRIFFLNCILLSFWAVCNALYYKAPTADKADFWYQVSSISWSFFPTLILHFFLKLTKSKPVKNIFFIILLYLISLFFFIKNCFGFHMNNGVIFFSGYWHPVINKNDPWLYVYYAYIISFLMVTLVIIIRWLSDIKNSIEKRQTIIILISFLISLILSLITNIILPLFEFYLMPEITPILIIFSYIGIFLSIVKYKLMTNLPLVASEEIISKSKEIFIFLNYEDKIVMVNDCTKEVLDYADNEIIGSSIQNIIEFDYGNDIHNCNECRSNLKSKNSVKIPVRISVSHIRSRYGEILGTIIVGHDIREKLHLEEVLEKKKVLIKELYHRTRNNMQVISGLIQLRLNKISDNFIVEKLKNINNEIYSMALVHDVLYLSDSLSHINIDIYIEKLVELFLNNYEINNSKIKITFDVEKIPIIFDIAIPLSLVFSELLSNSFRYAFPDNRFGLIAISVCRIGENRILIKYYDDGIGFNPEIIGHENNYLGFEMIHTIVEGQLNGKVEIKSQNGFNCDMEIQTDLYSKRVEDE